VNQLQWDETQAITKGSALTEPLRRDLFERFLPESQRRKVLGTDIKPATLLAIKGDATRGKSLFSGLCIACHRANGVGIDFGPDLSHISTKWNRTAMLDQLLTPSKVIDPQWQLTTLELKTGESKVGFIAARSDTEQTLKMAGGLSEKIASSLITKTTTAPISTMPEGLLQTLTAQEAADLLEYLDSLK
jgi:putative heme-binding domain-containing protein